MRPITNKNHKKWDYCKSRLQGLLGFIALQILKYTSTSQIMRSEARFKHVYDKSLPVDFKIDFLLDYCKGKRVAHFGFVDSPFTKESIKSNALLHLKLKKVCSELIGIDNDADAVRLYSQQTGDDDVIIGDIYKLDDSSSALQNKDVYLMGEILEHLSNPGMALKSIYNIMADSSELIVTVPNASSLSLFRAALHNVEIVHHDHVCWYSIQTMTSLFQRYGFKVKNISFYLAGSGKCPGFIHRTFPFLSEGIIGIFQKEDKEK